LRSTGFSGYSPGLEEKAVNEFFGEKAIQILIVIALVGVILYVTGTPPLIYIPCMIAGAAWAEWDHRKKTKKR